MNPRISTFQCDKRHSIIHCRSKFMIKKEEKMSFFHIIFKAIWILLSCDYLQTNEDSLITLVDKCQAHHWDRGLKVINDYKIKYLHQGCDLSHHYFGLFWVLEVAWSFSHYLNMYFIVHTNYLINCVIQKIAFIDCTSVI